jgi:hypothetical protein
MEPAVRNAAGVVAVRISSRRNSSGAPIACEGLLDTCRLPLHRSHRAVIGKIDRLFGQASRTERPDSPGIPCFRRWPNEILTGILTFRNTYCNMFCRL